MPSPGRVWPAAAAGGTARGQPVAPRRRMGSRIPLAAGRAEGTPGVRLARPWSRNRRRCRWACSERFGAAGKPLPRMGCLFSLPLGFLGAYFWILRGFALAAFHRCPIWKGNPGDRPACGADGLFRLRNDAAALPVAGSGCGMTGNSRVPWLALGIPALALLAAGVVQILHGARVALPPCPMKSLCSIPTVTCGLTRCAMALSEGRWAEAFHWHPWPSCSAWPRPSPWGGISAGPGRQALSLPPGFPGGAAGRRRTAPGHMAASDRPGNLSPGIRRIPGTGGSRAPGAACPWWPA